MRILVTGAGGALGRKVVGELLDLGIHHITAIDFQGSLPEEWKYKVHADSWKIFDIRQIDWNSYFISHPFHKVIHLAEICDNRDEVIAITTNVNGTHNIIRSCAKHAIHCIVPVWEEDCVETKDVILSTLKYRRELPKFYNRGNAVFTRVELPIVITSQRGASSIYSFVSRVFDAIYLGNKFVMHPAEGKLDEFYRWVTEHNAVECILQCIGRRSRETQDIGDYSIVVRADHMIAETLHILGHPHIRVLSQRHDPITIKANSSLEDEVVEALATTLKESLEEIHDIRDEQSSE